MSAPHAVPVAEVKAASKAMLQKQLYAIMTSPTDGIGPVLANLEEHLTFQMSLERDGVLFAAGPLWSDDEQSWTGEGMVVVRAKSREEAIEIADRDPMHRCGARSFVVRPWMINEGRVSLRLDYSTQTFEIV
ncbi:MAG: hypothetical protein IBJ07_03515 [Rhizobiaceae bacterium]|nr:hypothetical protein [Rhizobiaceae bacterium]